MSMKPIELGKSASFFIANTAMAFVGPLAYIGLGRSYYSSIAITVAYIIMKTLFFISTNIDAKAANDEISPAILTLSATIDTMIVLVMFMKAKTHFIRPRSLPMIPTSTKPIIKSYVM